jgi:hypothetical protein
MNSDNRRRLFADLVNIDAWHEPFGSVARVDLHADIVFGMARLGGDAASPVRFRLRAKRAEVLVIIPDTEPLTVDRASVSRDTHNIHVTDEKTIKRGKSVKGKAGAKASLSKLTASVDVGVSGEAEVSSERKTKITHETGQMKVMQSKTAEGYYRWIIEPADGSHLLGRPWEASEAPRLKLIDRRANKSNQIPPCVRVEVRCKREDLSIEDVVVKDETLWRAIQGRLGHQNRMVAAESYIRTKLVEEGLEVRNFDDLFGDITLGSVIAEPTKSQ